MQAEQLLVMPPGIYSQAVHTKPAQLFCVLQLVLGGFWLHESQHHLSALGRDNVFTLLMEKLSQR